MNNSIYILLILFTLIIGCSDSGKSQPKKNELKVELIEDRINCGRKAITLKNGNIDKIYHEDGTMHSGASVSKNWNYDGSSIKHRYEDDRIPCGTKPQTRDEIIKDLSSQFVKNPSMYGMNKEEAKLMVNYTANLMTFDKTCHLLVDAAKSTQRKGMYYIDCNDSSANSSRYWVSDGDLKTGIPKPPETPIPEADATKICNTELRSKTTNPTTYDPSLLTGTTSRTIKLNGRNVVKIDFTAKSSIGVESKFRGRCILESGVLIEAVIENR